MSFSFVGRLFSGVKGLYNEINSATLTGAIDVIVIKHKDGTYQSSPFHVRFGKLGVLRSREKVVDIEINGKPVKDLHMKLGEAGEAFFVEELDEDTFLPEDLLDQLATSPIPSGASLMEKGVAQLKREAAEAEIADRGQLQVPSEASTSSEPIKFRTSLNFRLKDTVKSDSSHDEMSETEDVRRKVFKKRKCRSGKTSPRGPVTPQQEEQEEIFNMEVSESSEDEGAVSPQVKRTSTLFEDAGFKSSLIHPLSDREFSPVGSPLPTRPPSPKSDTEVDRQHVEDCQNSLLMEDSATWEWGDFPKAPTSDNKVELTSSGNKDLTGGKQGPESGGLLQNFLSGKAKGGKSNKPETEGIYLEDLDDPEIARLYLGGPNRFDSIKDREDDTESGRGASLPQSPHSVEGAIGYVSYLESEVRHLGSISLSLCGGLGDPEEITLEKFMQKVVTFDDLCENPNMIINPDLVVKIVNKYYNWSTAAPIILSQSAFNKDLPEPTVKSLIKEHMPKKKKKTGVTSWFSWRRTNNEDEQAEVSTTSADNIPISDASEPMPAVAGAETEMTSKRALSESSSISPPGSPPLSIGGTPQKTNRLKEDECVSDHSSGDPDKDGQIQVDSLKETMIKIDPDPVPEDVTSSPVTDRFIKTLRLSSSQIEKLGLHEGQNEITFSVTTQYQGTTKCASHIYLWNYDDKIVVSDIDGTITKSDVLGQILPILGRDWSQSGVAHLFTRIRKNGYKLLYLSSRAIGQSRLTKDLLRNIKQGDRVLPDGPLLLNPTSLISAFHKEVIIRKPELFKISCLKDIAELFPQSPFYAGFGNKINDVYAYTAIDIPNYRIFTINARGELRNEFTRAFQSSYTGMSDVVDHFFPPLEKMEKGVSVQFSNVNYWRDPLPSISDDQAKAMLVDLASDKSKSRTDSKIKT